MLDCLSTSSLTPWPSYHSPLLFPGNMIPSASYSPVTIPDSLTQAPHSQLSSEHGAYMTFGPIQAPQKTEPELWSFHGSSNSVWAEQWLRCSCFFHSLASLFLCIDNLSAVQHILPSTCVLLKAHACVGVHTHSCTYAHTHMYTCISVRARGKAEELSGPKFRRK